MIIIITDHRHQQIKSTSKHVMLCSRGRVTPTLAVVLMEAAASWDGKTVTDWCLTLSTKPTTEGVNHVNHVQTDLTYVTRNANAFFLSFFLSFFSFFFEYVLLIVEKKKNLTFTFQRFYFLTNQSGSTTSFRAKCLFSLTVRRCLHYYTVIPTVLVTR